MYEQFYGLKEKPFSLTPDPEFLFLNEDHQAALDHVLYGIRRREGFTVIVGDVGTGKTTLCWALLERLDTKNLRTALILNPLLSEEDILKSIVQDLVIRPAKHRSKHQPKNKPDNDSISFDTSWMQGMSKKELIDQLNTFLTEMAENDVFTVLIIDEAQDLSQGVLEQLRLLSNLETAKKKLLQIIFVGQIEFYRKLKLPELRQLNQRISIRFEIKPLSKDDTEKYINHRLSVAGGPRKLGFTDGALNKVYKHSKGYPRLINLICDRALLAGYNERKFLITSEMVREGIRNLEGKDRVSRRFILGSIKRPFALFASFILVLLIVFFLLVFKGLLPISVSSFHDVAPGSRSSSAPGMTPDPGRANVKNEPPAPTSPRDTPKPEEPAQEVKPKPASRQKVPDSSGEDYFLQVHSLKTKEQAGAALARLEQNGYAGFIRAEGNEAKGEWFVVYVGPFKDLDDAQKSAAILKEQDKVNPIIAKPSRIKQ